MNTSVVDPQIEFAGAKEPSLTDDSDVQVLVKHDFSDTFERGKSDGKFVGEGELHYNS